MDGSNASSRFITESDLDAAKEKKEEQWKAAFARIGQEPPKAQVEDSFDGRSLAEKLAANKIKKQEEYEEKTKLANQFRALEEDEIMFLDTIREKKEAEERQRELLDGVEVKSFRQAVAKHTSMTNQTAAPSSSTSTSKPPSKPKPPPTKAPKKDLKTSLKGVVVKKKPKPKTDEKAAGPDQGKKRKASPEIQGDSKRRRDSVADETSQKT